MAPIDIVLLIVVGIACVRGLAIGLTREVLSVLALGAVCIALRTVWTPLAHWVAQVAGFEWLAARLAAAGILVAAGLVALLVAGAIVRRVLRATGLSFWDRVFGGLLGVAEGAVLAGLLLLLGIVAMGRDHPLLAHTRALAAFERLESLAPADSPLHDVAAPPR